MTGKKDFKLAKINILKTLFASDWMMMTGTVNLFYHVNTSLSKIKILTNLRGFIPLLDLAILTSGHLFKRWKSSSAAIYRKSKFDLKDTILDKNNCGVFHILTQFLFTTSETELDYHRQKVSKRIITWLTEQFKT